jgi:MarR family transcriptional regulator for hemolysin
MQSNVQQPNYMTSKSSADQTYIYLATALAQAARAYRAGADKVAAGFGLSEATGLPVLVIGRFGEHGVRPGVLADTLGLEPSSLVRVVDQLIASNLLLRQDDVKDRRARILSLTPEGKRIADAMECALLPFRQQVFGAFAPADVEACLRVLAGLPHAVAAVSLQPDAAGV